MITSSRIAEIAAALNNAELNRNQIGLLSLRYPQMDINDAYAIQNAWVARKRAAGQKVVGWKIGLTSKAMQAALNIDTPDSGVLFDSMMFNNAAIVAANRFIQPRVEAEIAFVMRKAIEGPNATFNDVLAAADYVVPALEILDTRIMRADPETKRTRSVLDTIADNAANAGIVLGDKRMRLNDIDLRWIGAIVSRDGTVEETGLAAGVLDHPANAVAWLANRISAFGERIEAGQLVLSGSFIRPVEAPHKVTVSADFGPWGIVKCHFA